MRKLMLTCECGERMHVPRSALGKTGLCPSCGRAIPIRPDNTVPAQQGGAPHFPKGPTGAKSDPGSPNEDDKRRFGEAVDLYFAKRYAEALSVFNALLERYPGNAEIETGRALCVKGLHVQPALALEDKRHRLDGKNLSADFVKNFVMDLMLNGTTEDVQLKAAELACRMLGMIGVGKDNANGKPTPIDLPDELDRIRESLATEHDAAADSH